MDENMRVLPVRKDGKFCYNIILKADFTKLGEQVKTLGVEGRKLCIVADAKAGELYGEAVRAELLKVTDILSYRQHNTDIAFPSPHFLQIKIQRR